MNTGKKSYKVRNMKDPVLTLHLRTVKYTVICFGVGLSQLVKEKRSGFLSSAVCLQHDNVRRHAARHTVIQVQDLKLEVLLHPPY
jgi:hypothetical protein